MSSLSISHFSSPAIVAKKKQLKKKERATNKMKKLLEKDKKKGFKKKRKRKNSGKHNREIRNIIRKSSEECFEDLKCSLLITMKSDAKKTTQAKKLKKVFVKETEKNKDGYKTKNLCFSLKKIHNMLQKRFTEGVRPCVNSVQNSRLIPVLLDQDFEPKNRVFSQGKIKPSETSQITTGHSGSAKKKYGKPTTDGFSRGEDRANSIHLSLPEGFEEFQIVWNYIFDGHGGNGQETANECSKLFQKAWTDMSGNFCELSESRKDQEILVLIKKLFAQIVVEVEHKIKEKKWQTCYRTAGSTATQILTITTPTGRKTSYACNVGDSPAAALILSGGRASKQPKIFSLTCEQSWGHQDEMERYSRHVWNLRKEAKEEGNEDFKEIKPSKVIYGRINAKNGPRVSGNGVFPVWKFVPQTDEKGVMIAPWKVKFDSESHQRLMKELEPWGKDTCSGFQSETGKEFLIVRENTILSPLNLTENWGSCAYDPKSGIAGCQCSRGIGDLNDRYGIKDVWGKITTKPNYTSIKPTCTAFEIAPDEEVVIVAMSDGAGDIVSFPEIADFLADDKSKNGKVMAEKIFQKVLTKCQELGGQYKIVNGMTSHDDVTISCAYLPANK